MLEEKTNLRSKNIKGTETYGNRPTTMNQTHKVIGTCAAHISWNLRSRDSEVNSQNHILLFFFKYNKIKRELYATDCECFEIKFYTADRLPCFGCQMFKK